MTDKKVSEYTLEEALAWAGLEEGRHYPKGKPVEGVVALAAYKLASEAKFKEDTAALYRLRDELNKALAALRRIPLADGALPESVVQPVCEARDRLREAGAQNA